jgi:uncharacterized coiled-coil protein SlyX
MSEPALPEPAAWIKDVSLKALKRDETTVLAYPHDYLIRPSVALYTADQLRAALAAQANGIEAERSIYTLQRAEFMARIAELEAEQQRLLDELDAEVIAQQKDNDALHAELDVWKSLYQRAINEANGLTNYVEYRPELRSAEKRLSAIEEAARAAKGKV